MKQLLIITILFLSLDGVCQSLQGFSARGFIDTYHAVRLSEPNDFLASRSRVRGEIQKVNGNSYFFVSVNAAHNNVLPDQTKFFLREAFLEYTGDKWGLKAGRQIIIWGRADGLKITDVISPMDLTEFLAQDYDDIRMPVNAFTLSRFGENWDLDLVCVPVFESYILPGKGNPWAIDPANGEEGIIIDPGEKPGLALENIEYGGKLSFYYSGIDFEFSALNTFNKMPVYSYYVNDSTPDLHLKPEYHRLGFIGAGFSKSLSAFIIRGESAFYFGKRFSPCIEHFEEGLIQRNSINYLLGIDWYPGMEWTLTAQFSDEWITGYTDKIFLPEHNWVSTVGVSKKVFHGNLKISSFAYIGLKEGDLFNRSSLDYALSDNIHLSLGLDWFHGDSGLFGQYNKNSQVWVKAKYSF
jgi:hypothetical protein